MIKLGLSQKKRKRKRKRENDIWNDQASADICSHFSMFPLNTFLVQWSSSFENWNFA